MNTLELINYVKEKGIKVDSVIYEKEGSIPLFKHLIHKIKF